jgi:hypothetical protein
VNREPELTISWIDFAREPKQLPDPRYPTGIDLDLSKGASQTCNTTLPYPAKRVGAYSIKCEKCGLTTMVTTAGRADDPRSIKLACKGH